MKRRLFVVWCQDSGDKSWSQIDKPLPEREALKLASQHSEWGVAKALPVGVSPTGSPQQIGANP